MRILSINNTADIYGASRCLERVFGRLAKDGHEVHVVLPEVGPIVAAFEAQGVTVHIHRGLCTIERARVKTIAGLLRVVLLFPYSVIWLTVLTLALRIDVIHTNTVVMPTPALAAFITRRKHVWHVRELLTEFGSLWKPYQRYVYTLSTAIVAISNCTRDQFEPTLRDKIRVIYDGIDDRDQLADAVRIADFRRRFPHASQLVGVVGRIKWHRKGQEVLVRAAARIRRIHPGVHHVLIGTAAPGNESHVVRLRELIEQFDLGDAVTLVGDVQEPSHIFAALDITVVPSVQAEPFGCVVMEAMAVGTPVIGSRCGGIAEQIVDGSTGILFPPGDDAALAAALEKLLTDEVLRGQMGQNGLRHAWNCFHLDATCQAMDTLFKQITTGTFVTEVKQTSMVENAKTL